MMGRLELAISHAIKSYAKHYLSGNCPYDYVEGYLHGLGYGASQAELNNITLGVWNKLIKEGLYNDN
jgi:hypothetical protein